ncbi:MAG: aldose 1-epimerase [Sphingomonadaceae bacterium]
MNTAPAPLQISAGTSLCTIHSEIGGSLGSWIVGGQPMLHSAALQAITARTAFGMSSFPLVPYSNRIGGARFAWDGETHMLAFNAPPEVNAIHGVGFNRPWAVMAQSECRITLGLHHQSDQEWPWPFAAEQSYAISDDTLTITMRACNLAAKPVPLAFGHHPYFDQDGAQLTFTADRVWMAGTDSLPTMPVTPHGNFDFSAPSLVSDHEVDHCFAGWDGTAHIMWAGRAHALEIATSPNLPAAVVYIPKDGAAFCFEPVPHINNALNLAPHEPAMPVIAPGEMFEAEIVMRATLAG